MPSGAKKRKAAKKKKEMEAYLSSSTTSNNSNDDDPRGDDDVKIQDEKDSDGGEVNSPAAQDLHQHQHLFNEGNKEVEKGEPSPGRSSVPENKSMEGDPRYSVGTKDDGVVEVEWDFRSEEDLDSKNDSIEHVDSSKELHDGDNRSSSSSSSDDESGVTDKKAKGEAYHSDLKTAPFTDLVNPIDSLSEQEIRVTENAPVGEIYNSTVESVPVVEPVKLAASVSEEVILITESAPIESSVVVSNLVGSGLKENGKNPLPKSDEVLKDVMDLESKKNEDKVFPLSDENAGASSSLVESSPKENEVKVSLSSGASCAEASNSAEHFKHSEIPVCSEDQPLGAPATRPEQTNFWKSCCGLFDVLTGSK